jgi:membrane protein YqaA with SNARE-associated domain
MHIASFAFSLALKFGGVGLLVLGVLDSSYLFIPWGNDVLLIALTSRKPEVLPMLYYAAMSTVGSVLGCLVIDLTMRPLGAKGLEKYLPRRSLNRVRGKVEGKAGRAIALASLAPPPFPFTPFIIAAAALQYSRTRMLLVVGWTRLLRFVAIGALALHFGKRILKWADNPTVQGLLIGLIVLCIVGSIVSVIGWIRNSRR